MEGTVIMNDSAKTLIEGLKHAIQTEADGYQFYLMAAEKTKDGTGKEMFRILAEEELRHKEFLYAQYKSITDTGHIDANLELGEPSDFGSGIFSSDIVKRLNDSQFEMSALSIGIQLELSSIDFYKMQVELATDPDVKKFFNELVIWEQKHYQALLRQHDMLKEEFWAQGGFAPF